MSEVLCCSEIWAAARMRGQMELVTGHLYCSTPVSLPFLPPPLILICSYPTSVLERNEDLQTARRVSKHKSQVVEKGNTMKQRNQVSPLHNLAQDSTKTAGRMPPGLSSPTRNIGFEVVSFQMGVAPRMGWGQVETRGETRAMGDPRGV